jgi:hypothetical protein
MMKVAALIAMLEGENQDADVHFSYGYGDHWRTQVAPKISEVFEGTVCYSEYHRMDKLIEVDYDNEDEDNEKVRRVVVIG